MILYFAYISESLLDGRQFYLSLHTALQLEHWRWYFGHFDLEIVALVLVVTAHVLHLQVIEPSVKLFLNRDESLLQLLLSLLVLFFHFCTLHYLPAQVATRHSKNHQIFYEQIVEIVEKDGFGDRQYHGYAENGKKLVVEMDAAIDETLGLLIGADEKLLIDEVDQLAQSCLVHVHVGHRCLVQKEAQSRVTAAVYFNVFCHRIYASLKTLLFLHLIEGFTFYFTVRLLVDG